MLSYITHYMLCCKDGSNSLSYKTVTFTHRGNKDRSKLTTSVTRLRRNVADIAQFVNLLELPLRSILAFRVPYPNVWINGEHYRFSFIACNYLYDAGSNAIWFPFIL